MATTAAAPETPMDGADTPSPFARMSPTTALAWSGGRAPVVIDVVADEFLAPSRASQAAPFARRSRALPLFAAILLGLGAGFAGGVWLYTNVSETNALADANDTLRARVSELEKANAAEAIERVRSGIDEIRTATAERAGEMGARLEKIERVVATRYPTLDPPAPRADSTSSIKPATPAIDGRINARPVRSALGGPGSIR
jgi:hypothetical protein